MKYHEWRWQGAIVGDISSQPLGGHAAVGFLIRILKETDDPSKELEDWKSGRWLLVDKDFRYPPRIAKYLGITHDD